LKTGAGENQIEMECIGVRELVVDPVDKFSDFLVVKNLQIPRTMKRLF